MANNWPLCIHIFKKNWAWHKHKIYNNNKLIKKTHHKTKLRKTTQNQPTLGLFTFVVLLHVDVGVVDVVIFLYCSKKWLLSYALMCPQNLEIRLTTNLNGIVMRLTTNPIITEIGIEHGSQDPSFFFRECPHYNFLFFVLLCPSLPNISFFLFLHGANY